MMEKKTRWDQCITRYQWVVLAIASAGWIFDAFEGQVFGVLRGEMLAEMLAKPAGDPEVKRWGDILIAVFQLGGTLGGWLFSSLADRWGRKPVMIWTILFYSVFSGLTCFASNLTEVAALRFLVAMGVGGEWAVGAALVAETFSDKARAQAASIFHSSSILGVWLAVTVGLWVESNWRLGFLMSALPALLVLWVRKGLVESEPWEKARKEHREVLGSYRELLGTSPWRQHAIGGMLLATVGMATFWGVTLAGMDLYREMLLDHGVEPTEARRQSQLTYAFIQGSGAAIGMVLFGPISERIGRRGAFAFYHVGALLVVPAVCWLPQVPWQMFCLLPFFGFFTLGMHAGYAVYFPELFPGHLRATGAGFCFNSGRLASAGVLYVSGMLKAAFSLPAAMTILAGFFLLVLLILPSLPETKEKSQRSDETC
jgi:MFS family permease